MGGGYDGLDYSGRNLYPVKRLTIAPADSPVETRSA